MKTNSSQLKKPIDSKISNHTIFTTVIHRSEIFKSQKEKKNWVLLYWNKKIKKLNVNLNIVNLKQFPYCFWQTWRVEIWSEIFCCMHCLVENVFKIYSFLFFLFFFYFNNFVIQCIRWTEEHSSNSLNLEWNFQNQRASVKLVKD